MKTLQLTKRRLPLSRRTECYRKVPAENRRCFRDICSISAPWERSGECIHFGPLGLARL
jgi:hypothetical protein